MKNRVPTQAALVVSSRDKERNSSGLHTLQQITSIDFLQFLPDIAWVVDEDGHLVNANPNFFKTFRLDPRRSIERLIIALIPPEISARLCAQHRNVFNSGQAAKSEVSVDNPDGNRTVYQISLFPIPSIGGRRLLAGIANTLHQSKQQQQPVPQPVPSPEIVRRALQMERTRIGHELHDNVNQVLSSAALYIDALKPENDRQGMIRKKSRDYILLAIEEIRNLTRKLVTPANDCKPLGQQIEVLLDDLRSTTSLDIVFKGLPDDGKVSTGTSQAFFRIVQEQVRNILTHSKATEVSITLREAAGNMLLEITDNGIGFDQATTPQGVGLTGIRTRVAEQDGQLTIITSPGQGCRISVSIPLK